MQVRVGGKWIKYQVRIERMVGRTDVAATWGRVARNHVLHKVCAFLSKGKFDRYYVHVAMTLMQRITEKHTDPPYWTNLRGRPGSEVLAKWEEEQGIDLGRRARAHRRASNGRQGVAGL